MSAENLSTINSKLELKDPLYYDDLIYMIEIIRFISWNAVIDRNLIDKVRYERIALRLQPIHSEQQKQENEIQGEELSDFTLDLFLIVRQISKMAGKSFRSIETIGEYPELVQKVLVELKQKNKDNVLLNHLKLIVKNMRSEHAFSLGESALSGVSLNKSDNVWEVSIVERGISYEKSVFNECYYACLEVIHQLADSKQMEKKAKKEFALVKKKIQN